MSVCIFGRKSGEEPSGAIASQGIFSLRTLYVDCSFLKKFLTNSKACSTVLDFELLELLDYKEQSSGVNEEQKNLKVLLRNRNYFEKRKKSLDY